MFWWLFFIFVTHKFSLHIRVLHHNKIFANCTLHFRFPNWIFDIICVILQSFYCFLMRNVFIFFIQILIHLLVIVFRQINFKFVHEIFRLLWMSVWVEIAKKIIHAKLTFWLCFNEKVIEVFRNLMCCQRH